MFSQKETAGCEPAELEISLHSDFAKKIVNGQARSGYALEVFHSLNDKDKPRKFYLASSNAARSLLILYLIKIGVTRAEALGEYFLLSLTQHVSKIRHEWGLEIETERVPPTGYARYHLLSPVTIRILRQGGQ